MLRGSLHVKFPGNAPRLSTWKARAQSSGAGGASTRARAAASTSSPAPCSTSPSKASLPGWSGICGHAPPYMPVATTTKSKASVAAALDWLSTGSCPSSVSGNRNDVMAKQRVALPAWLEAEYIPERVDANLR